MTANGKWCLAGVPHSGWRCIGIEDMGEPDHLCEMCETTYCRYVHFMEHDHHSPLAVGCVCAGNMEGDLLVAQRREADLRKRLRPRSQKHQKYVKARAQADLWMNAIDRIKETASVTPWEITFLTDLRERFRTNCFFNPTDKQVLIFKELYGRIK